MIGSWDYLVAWLRAFLFTQAVEVPVYMLLGAFASRAPRSPITFASAITASAITHPAVWFVFPTIGIHVGLTFNMMVVTAELFAWLTEALFLITVVKVRPVSALLISLAANAASVLLGEASREVTFRACGMSYP